MKVNRVILSGTVTRDPDVQYNPRGERVITFSLAFSYPSTTVHVGQEEKNRIEVIALGTSLEENGEGLKEGRKVLVKGRLRQRKWKSPQGLFRSSLELVAEHIRCLERIEEED